MYLGSGNHSPTLQSVIGITKVSPAAMGERQLWRTKRGGQVDGQAHSLSHMEVLPQQSGSRKTRTSPSREQGYWVATSNYLGRLAMASDAYLLETFESARE